MSFLTRTPFRASAAPRLHGIASSRRAIHLTGPRAALSESDRSKDGEDVSKEIDRHKNEQLEEQKEGKGRWKGELASNSESAIKADRGEMEASDENIKKMQEETTKSVAEGREESK